MDHLTNRLLEKVEESNHDPQNQIKQHEGTPRKYGFGR
jgi:hypothetical protein